MIRRALTAAATAMLVGGLLQGLASPAEAVSPVRFAGVQYDSPGDDTGTNRSLNGEWVKITNHASRAKVMSGWKLRDRTGFRLRVPDLHPGRRPQRAGAHRLGQQHLDGLVLAAERLRLEQHG